jgi:hypothetical protein
MLFSHERALIFIDREKILWTKGLVPSGELLGGVQEVACSEENLQVVLADIAQNFPDRVRIVVGEEFSYVTRFQKKNGKSLTLGEVQALIPEKLEEGWDSKDGDADNVQVMAVRQQVFSVLQRLLLENNIKVEAIEAESISISRTVPEAKDNAILLARSDGKVLLEVVNNGMVLATRIFFQFPVKEKVQEFLDYASGRKNIAPVAAYVQDGTGELAKILQELGLDVQERVLDPMAGICLKKDIAGRDADVLNILPGKEGIGIGEEGKRESLALREKVLLAAFITVLLGGAAIAYFFGSK